MKTKHRVLSMLLALALIIGILPTVVPSVVEAAVINTPAGVRNHLPSTAKDIVYLSDMAYEYSDNYPDANFASRGYHFVKDGAWRTGKIVLGGKKYDTAATDYDGGTKFDKGLGVMPKNVQTASVAADRSNVSYTVFDLADNDYKQSFFYSAVGITNNQTADTGVVFEVWASYDKSVEDYTQAEFVLLEGSGTVKKTNVYQFHLDVTGARYLKLVVYAAASSISGMNCAWGGTCVYNNEGYFPKTDMISKRTNDGGEYVAFADRNATFKSQTPSMFNEFECMFNTYNYMNLPDTAIRLGSYGTGASAVLIERYVPGVSVSANWMGGTHYAVPMFDGTAKDHTWQKDGIKFAQGSSVYFKNKPNTTGTADVGYVVYNISELNVNRFYTIVGIVDAGQKYVDYDVATGNYGGVVFEIWGKYEGSDDFVLLSASEVITKSNTGEFFVDITGVQQLKLLHRQQDTRATAQTHGGFIYASIYCEEDVVIKGATTAVQGTEQTYTADVWSDTGLVTDYTGTITWAVTGAQKEGTKIDANGKLTIDPYETATELKVTASNGTVTSEPITVAVTASPVYTLKVQGPAEASKGTEHDISALVTKDGQPATYDNIAWELTGNTDTATKLENGKLTIGNEPIDTKLKIKASYTEYGILHEDTLEVTIIAYEIVLDGYTEMLSGGKFDLTASILNEGQPIAGTVEWSVEGIGNLAVNSNIATVRADNTVGRILVTAKWTSPAGTFITKSQEIIVNAYTIDVSGAANTVAKDSEVTINAKLEKNGAVIDGSNISWKIVNMLNAGVTEKTGAQLQMTITEEAGTVLMITASVEIGGQIVSDTFTMTVSDYKIVIDPASVEIAKGSSTELKATVTKGDTAVTNAVINWQVTNADGSALNLSGNALKLSADGEVGTVMTVVATAVIDNKTIVSAPATVTIVAAPEYKVTITNPATTIQQGETASFVAAVTKDGVADTKANLIWFLTGQTAAGTAIDSNGKLIVDEAEPLGSELKIAAAIVADGKLIVSEAVTVNVTMDAYKPYEGGGYMAVPGGAIYLTKDLEVDSLCLGDAPARYDEQWTGGAFKEIWLGGTTGGTVNQDGGVRFYKGVAMQPFAPGAAHPYGECYAVFDLSELDIDTFYAVVGLTNQVGQNSDENTTNGAYGGIYYEVYATYEENGEYKLIAKSDLITKTNTGEFTVNVEGVQLLKLVVKCKNNTGSAHASMSGMWANACVYSTKVDSYVITATGTATELKQGEELSFTASATKNGEAMTDAVITWAVTGGTKTGTKIDANGKLTVDAAEAAGTKLTITASITVGETTYTSTPIEVTVKEAPQTAGQADAYKPSNGTYMALPNGVIYLSEIDWTESKNLSDIVSIKNGTYKNGDAIWLGGASGGKVDDGTKFDKGLGVQPYNPNDGKNGAAHTIWDVSKLNVNTFYGVVGITNVNGQNYGYGDPYNGATFTGGGVIFQVFGDFGDGNFKLLAESEVISKTMTGEFKVNIEGVKLLKLVVKCNLDGSGNHASMNSAWGNACVYASSSTSTDSYTITATGTATNVQQGKNTSFTAAVTKNGEALTGAAINWTVTGGTKSGTKIDANGKLTIDKKEPAGTKLSVTASITVEGTTYSSAAVVITVDEAPSNYYQKDAFKANTTGKYAELSDKVIYLSDVTWIESVNLNGAQAIKNGAWQNGGAIWIGGESNADVKDGTEFKKGIGVQTQAPNSENNNGASWTTIDVSKLGCDTFYAAVGLTNKANQEFGHNSFIFQVYGATEKDGDFVLLAESAALSKTETGEFTVDIKDMEVLKLVIKCTENGSHAYGNSVWANACVYNKDGSAGNPDGGKEEKPEGEKPAQEGAYTTFNGAYMTPSGTIIYLSDIDWTVSNNLADIETIRDGDYKNGNPIWLGGESGGKASDGKKFTKGLGVMPFAPNDGKHGAADTIWDVSGLNVNTFYGVVGITNVNGQNYGFGDPYNDSTFAGGGVIFQVFGDYGDGNFKLLSESEVITKTLTGEFKVDITGVKLLKLVVKCNLDTGSGHTSMNSAWGNACVFNSETGSLEAGSTSDPTQPTEPQATKPKPTRPAKPTEPADDTDVSEAPAPTLIVIIVSGVILLLVIALVIALIVRKNKKRRVA